MWSKPVFDSDRKNILRNDYDNESKRLRRHLQICFLCRNFFRVWPTAIDERIAADPRNLALNPNLNASGGGDRRSANRIPNALHFKKPRPNLDLTETENDDPAERSFEIAPEDNEIGLEDPFDFNDGLRDAEADDMDNNSDGDISDGDIFDENNLDGNFFNDDNQDVDNGRASVFDDDHNQNVDDTEPDETESFAAPLNLESSFMNGKILFLPLTDGSLENALCALCHQIVDEDGEIITALLENRLRLNPVLSQNEEAFGIAFDYYTNTVDFQKICSDCLCSKADSDEGQTVYPKIFTTEFHKKFNNLSFDQPNNIQDLFSQAGCSVSMDCVRELRTRILDLEKEVA